MKKKKANTKGKVRLAVAFQELKKGDLIAVSRDLSSKINFPRRMEGRTGTVEGKRGKAFIVKMKDYNEEKTFILNPIHLKKL